MKFSNDVEKYEIGVTIMSKKKTFFFNESKQTTFLTVNALFSTNGVTSRCLVAFSVYFILPDQHFNWMTREKGY